MTPDPICPARHGRHRCERWDLPAAHTDGDHSSGRHRWPAADGNEQLALTFTDAATSAAPARTEAV